MPSVRVPVRRSGVRYTSQPGRRVVRRYPIPPVAAAKKKSNLAGLIGGLGGLLLCLLCLATLGLLGLFATFIPIVKYLGDIYNRFDDLTNVAAGVGNVALNLNMFALLAALCFASIYKLSR